MKLVTEGEPPVDQAKSEGKCLEVIPLIEDASGQPMMLPPAVWHVENWVLGFLDYHSLPSPMQFWHHVKTTIPGSNSANAHRLTFLVRILEDGQMPNGIPVGHIDAEAVKALIEAMRIAPDVYPEV